MATKQPKATTASPAPVVMVPEFVHTVKTAASTLDSSERFILDSLRDGTIPGRKVARKWLILNSDLLAYVRNQHSED